jgi:hypothetical protein
VPGLRDSTPRIQGLGEQVIPLLLHNFQAVTFISYYFNSGRSSGLDVDPEDARTGLGDEKRVVG